MNSGYQALFSDFSNGPGYEARFKLPTGTQLAANYNHFKGYHWQIMNLVLVICVEIKIFPSHIYDHITRHIQWWDSYVLCRCMSPVLNDSSAGASNAIEICKGKERPYVSRASFHEINSHEIKCHKINSRKINSILKKYLSGQRGALAQAM